MYKQISTMENIYRKFLLRIEWNWFMKDNIDNIQKKYTIPNNHNYTYLTTAQIIFNYLIVYDKKTVYT